MRRVWCPEDLRVLASKAQALADERALFATLMDQAMAMTKALPAEEMPKDDVRNLIAAVHWQHGLAAQDAEARARVNDFGRELKWVKKSQQSSCRGLSTEGKRRIILQQTLMCFENAGTQMREKAMSNLRRWSQREGVLTSMDRVAVFNSDWGVVASTLTKQFGVQFAVLNMANADLPGGGYVEGAAAQEENMFRRSDCHFAIDSGMLEGRARRYLPRWADLISAEGGEVYMDKKPRICVRGPEHPSRKDLGYRLDSTPTVFSRTHAHNDCLSK